MTPREEQAVALAGVAQAARLVDQLARTGSYPDRFLAASLQSLFQFDPPATDDVYGGLPGVKLGLDTLAAVLANRQSPEHREVIRYLFALLYLERRFSADPERMAVVRSRLEHANFRAEHFSSEIGPLCESLGGIYQDTLSTLRFRIKVTGSAQHLQDPRTAATVRALLLAGVRSAFLWRQLGGRRWKLLLGRGRLLATCQALSRELGVV